MPARVFYYIPEDGDDEDHPNTFSISSLQKAGEVTLGHVKESFPLPGAYHFRFKTQFKSTFVWMDVMDDTKRVPVNAKDGRVMCKVSRLHHQRQQMNGGGSASRRQSSNQRNSGRSDSAAQRHTSSGDLLGLDHSHSHSNNAPSTPTSNDLSGVNLHTPTPISHGGMSAPIPLHSAQSASAAVHSSPMQPMSMQQQQQQQQHQQPTNIHRSVSAGSISSAQQSPDLLGGSATAGVTQLNWSAQSHAAPPISPAMPTPLGDGSPRRSSAPKSKTGVELHSNMAAAAKDFQL